MTAVKKDRALPQHTQSQPARHHTATVTHLSQQTITSAMSSAQDIQHSLQNILNLFCIACSLQPLHSYRCPLQPPTASHIPVTINPSNKSPQKPINHSEKSIKNNIFQYMEMQRTLDCTDELNTHSRKPERKKNTWRAITKQLALIRSPVSKVSGP